LYDFPLTGNGLYRVVINPEFAKKIEEGLEKWGKLYRNSALYIRMTLKTNSFLDLDEYLPKETLAWCYRELASYGIDLQTLATADIDLRDENFGEKLHVCVYSHLQAIVQKHIRAERAPYLVLCPDLTGGYN
jgi:hypothetical protein